MAYTTPPTFTSTTLTAAQLNILSDDVEWLNGIVRAPHMSFARLFTAQATVHSYYLRKRTQYLNVNISYLVDSGQGTVWHWHLDVIASGGTNTDADSDTSNYTATSDTADSIGIDLDALTYVPADDEWYRVDITCTFYNGGSPQATRGSSYLYVNYLYESDTSL